MELFMAIALTLAISFANFTPLWAVYNTAQKRPANKRNQLIWGIFLIVFSAIIFSSLNSNIELFKTTEEAETIVKFLGVWVYIFPAINLSIGCNLITNSILHEA